LTIVHLSHLAWERRLFQRPQQLATRFATSGNQVAYFCITGMRRYMDMKLTERTIEGVDGRLHAQNLPWFPFSQYSALSRRASLALLESKAKAWLRKSREGTRVLWLQHPASLDSAGRLPHDLLVYDAMDPFGAFKGSDGDVLETEDRLLEKADLVFTGGRSLHAAIETRRSDAHCFPSGIDFDHFSRGADAGEIPADLKRLDKPVLGYFGAVDERIDWKLIEHICRERRHWSIVFLGPLIMMDRVPIDEPNFHWLGPKPYDRLPDYLRGFDVCLIPWLVNDLTKFMSPTKTPEYLAAGRPVVSTSIPDVVADYREEVHVADDAASFIEKCTAALREGVTAARKPPQSRTWQETADQMLALIHARLK
ncbi:MAG: glycosyltransferase, partial [Candidatus Sumerlaeia bacterium]|nr:glycosyltransferase [Candidatus Sumerlaeia bacterium]